MKKILYLIRKNFLIEIHYKFSLFSLFFSTLFTLLIFFMIDKYFKSKISPFLSVDYFSYIFSSFLIFNYSSNQIITNSITSDINMQIFENLVENKFINYYLWSLIIYSFIISTTELFLFLIFAKLTGILNFNINYTSLIILILISSLSFSALSIITASFTVLFKRGNIISFLISVIESFFSGVYFPIEVISDFLRPISKILPMTYSIKASYKIFYLKSSFFNTPEIKILLIFCIFLPFSFYLFKKSVYLSKKLGNLSQY